MSDLVEVLRMRNPETDPDCHAAADEIKRLQASLAYNIEALSKADAMNAKLQEEYRAYMVLAKEIKARDDTTIAKLQAVVYAAKRHIRTCVMHVSGGPTELHKALAALEKESETLGTD